MNMKLKVIAAACLAMCAPSAFALTAAQIAAAALPANICTAALPAQADVIVNNNLSTDSSYYGDFGINSSVFSGTGSLSLPNATYLYSANGDLAIGTSTSNALHFVVNSSATDSLTISTLGAVSVTSTAATNVGMVVVGAASQSADLQEWQNSSNTVLAKIDSKGNLTANNYPGLFVEGFLTGCM